WWRPPGAVWADARVTRAVGGAELVSRLAHRRRHTLTLGDGPRNRGAVDFDPGYVAVMTDTDLAEAQRPQRCFRCFDLAERGHRDLRAVRDARREARK